MGKISKRTDLGKRNAVAIEASDSRTGLNSEEEMEGQELLSSQNDTIENQHKRFKLKR